MTLTTVLRPSGRLLLILIAVLLLQRTSQLFAAVSYTHLTLPTIYSV